MDRPKSTRLAWAYNMVLTSETESDATFVVAGPWAGVAPQASPLHVGYQLNATNQDFMPLAVRVNGVQCEVGTVADPSVPAPPIAPESVLDKLGLRRSWAAEKPVSTKDAQFVGVDGAPLTIKGLNWFGFENGQTIVDGLWGQVSNGIVSDFATVAWRIKLMGFNTIRLPFSFQVLNTATPHDPTYKYCHLVQDSRGWSDGVGGGGVGGPGGRAVRHRNSLTLPLPPPSAAVGR